MAQDPLWDEEVVPALRKRLQSESKTLARRLSAISLPSGDEARSQPGSKGLNPQKHHLDQVQVHQQHQPKPKTQTQAQTLRQRTYSSPKNPHPTRIPKARQMSGGSISANGHSRHQHTPSQEDTPKPKQMPPSSSSDSRLTFDVPRSPTRGLGLLHESPPFLIDSMSSSSSAGGGLYTHVNGQRYGLGLGQTQAHDDTDERSQAEEDPPRPSIDSEERPYEHWYRGEVSRNGGVGELKVGRRQEMLDIANYGHLIRSRKAGGGNGGVGVGMNGKGVGGGAGNRENGYLDLLQLRRKRPRAGSIGGLTRKERDSLYLDEMDEDAVGTDGYESWRGGEDDGVWGERVLDQDPPTDFDKDDDDDEDAEEQEEEDEDEEGVEENDDNERTPTAWRGDESQTQHNVTHNLNHNYQEPQSDDDDFVFINHPPQTTSNNQPYPYAYAYIPTEADVLNIRSSTSDSTSSRPSMSLNGTPNSNTGERWTPTAGAHQTQKPVTYPTNSTIPPTATPIPPLPRPSSRQTQASGPPSRIPHPSSSSRRSSDSRSTHNGATTPTQGTTSMVPRATTPTSIRPHPTRSKSEPPSSLGGASASTSNSTSTPQGAPPSSFNKRSTSPGSTSNSSSPSPSQLTPKSSASKKSANNSNSRTKTNSKPRAKPKSKSKPPPTKQEKSDKRSSVAMYPTVEGGEELADAIPSWTQPLTREGNWDDVVLPVVARKKGLEGYFENTNPHLQLKKRLANGVAQEIVAPAPGTFGFDHSKYRHPRIGDDAGGDEFVELDEFGVSNPPPPLVEAEAEDTSQKHPEDEERNMYAAPNSNPSPTAKPMMQVQGQMLMTQIRVEKEHDKEVEGGAGCCKCVVM